MRKKIFNFANTFWRFANQPPGSAVISVLVVTTAYLLSHSKSIRELDQAYAGLYLEQQELDRELRDLQEMNEETNRIIQDTEKFLAECRSSSYSTVKPR